MDEGPDFDERARNMDDPRTRFIELLNQDAKQFEDMADNLEKLIPSLAGDRQQKRAALEVSIRRLRAQELRLLIERVRED
jgi:hypothetical protein